MPAALEERLIRQGNGEGCTDFGDDETLADEISIDGQANSHYDNRSPDIEPFPQSPFPEIKPVDSAIDLREDCISDLMQAELYVPQVLFLNSVTKSEEMSILRILPEKDFTL